NRPPEHVEARADQLLAMLEQSLQSIRGRAWETGDRERAVARSEVKAFYHEHADLIREVHPRYLFRAEVKAATPDRATPSGRGRQQPSFSRGCRPLSATSKCTARRTRRRSGPARSNSSSSTRSCVPCTSAWPNCGPRRWTARLSSRRSSAASTKSAA